MDDIYPLLGPATQALVGIGAENDSLRLEAEIPSILYHYTTMEGLRGIIESGELWATDIRFLNDARELKPTIDAARMAIDDNREALGPYASGLQGALALDHGVPSYVFSMTSESDALGQWRAYAKGSGGVAIGFDAESLRESLGEQGFSLAKVDYSAVGPLASTLRLCASTVRAINELHASFDGSPDPTTDLDSLPEETRVALAEARSRLNPHDLPFGDLTLHQGVVAYVVTPRFQTELMRLAPLFKDRAFQSEKEWRCVSDVSLISPLKDDPAAANTYDRKEPFQHLGMRFRSGTSTVIPYIAPRFANRDGTVPISTIVVGPCPDPEMTALGIKLLVGQPRLGDIEVTHSGIPFRDW